MGAANAKTGQGGRGARVYSRKLGRWLPYAAPWSGKGGTDGPALDRPFTPPGGSEPVTWRAVFSRLRERGIAPHTLGPLGDEAMAQRLHALAERVPLARAAPGRSDLSGLEVPGGVVQDEPDADVAPSRWFGVAEAYCPVDADEEAVFGTYDDIVGDLAAMGAGSLRRCKWRDVLWGSLFRGPSGETGKRTFQNGAMVPPPAQILQALRRYPMSRLAAFGELLDACRVAGIRLAITPFDAGGGATLNVKLHDELSELDEKFPLASGDSWEDLLASRPPWHAGVRVPSTEGWARFYWDHGDGTDEERLFERYAIHVWPTRAEDPGALGLSTAYSRECARRKSLAIAAFAQGIAEYLAATHAAWTEAGLGSIYDVVDVVELGNELDAFFVRPEPEEGGLPAPFDGEPRPGTPAAIAENGAGILEVGRYMTLIAAPIRALLPSMKFRAPELASWGPIDRGAACLPRPGCCTTDDYELSLEWLREVIASGVPSALRVEIQHQRRLARHLSEGDELPDDTVEWRETCEAAGFFWPEEVDTLSETLDLRATDLVHQVGTHWYHMYDRDADAEEPAEWRYRDAVRMERDLVRMRDSLAEPLESAGFAITRSVGEVAFLAVTPVLDEPETQFYAQTTTRLQAAMLARLLLSLRASGVKDINWFCHYLKPLRSREDGTPAEWTNRFQATGLRNDLYLPGQYQVHQAEGAWRRPAWFTFRRVSWLLARTRGTGTFVYNRRGITVLRFQLRERLSMAPTTPDERGFSYLWFAWLDQYSDSECIHAPRLAGEPGDDREVGARVFELRLRGVGTRGYELVPLVPEVGPSDPPEPDANNYRQVGPRNWRWPGWDEALVLASETGGDGDATLNFLIQQCAPDRAVAPLAILTDADDAVVVDYGGGE